MDYNGYRIKPEADASFRWRYPVVDSLNHADRDELTWIMAKDLKEFFRHTGNEEHGVELGYGIFEQVEKPDPGRRGKVYPREGFNFALKPNSKATDAGCELPNINDNYTGNGPDLGAVETGLVQPHYGPRH